MQAKFINEGVTLIIENSTQRLAVEVDDHNRVLLEELAALVNRDRK